MRYRSSVRPSVDVKLITRGREGGPTLLLESTNQGRKERRNERVNADSVCLSVGCIIHSVAAGRRRLLFSYAIAIRPSVRPRPSYRDSVDFRNYFASLFGAPGPACPVSTPSSSLTPSLPHSCPMYTVNSEYEAAVVGGRKARPYK